MNDEFDEFDEFANLILDGDDEKNKQIVAEHVRMVRNSVLGSVEVQDKLDRNIIANNALLKRLRGKE